MKTPEIWYQITEYLDRLEWAQNGGMDYARAILAFVVIFFGVRVFERIIVKKIRQISLRTKTHLDDHIIATLDDISGFFYFFISLYGALQFLTIPELAKKIFDSLFIILAFVEVTKVVLRLTDLVFEKTTKKSNTSAIHGIKLLIKIGLWITALLLILSNLGIDISGLFLSMGIGGIAIALAAQNIFSDLFASFSIYFDRPFEIGDYIVLGADKGTVEKIGLKSTRIRTLQGEELVVANQELTSTRIQNFKKMKRRRVDFQLGVEYGTPNKKLEKIVPTVQEIINAIDGAEFTRGHFMEFGNSSLNFDFVYHVESSKYAEYADVHQQVNFAIKKAFEALKIEMAFPTQTIHMAK